MTKAKLIVIAHRAGLTQAAIADKVRCHPRYVSAAIQRWRAGGKRPCDLKWGSKDRKPIQRKPRVFEYRPA